MSEIRRRSFIGILLSGIAATACAAPKAISSSSMIAKFRKKFGRRMWDAASGGFIGSITMVDCRDPKNPVQFRSAIVCPEGMSTEKAAEYFSMLGKSAGRKIMYITGYYDNWPEIRDTKIGG